MKGAVRDLDLRDGKFDELSFLVKFIRENPKIKNINLGGRYLPESKYQPLLESVKEN